MRKTIVITGAGSGIGRGMAQVISNRLPDVSLVLTGRNKENLLETLELLQGKKNHEVFQLDVTDASSIRSLRSHLEQTRPYLTGLVLNAGIGGENVYGESDRWDEIIATNLKGPYQVTQELLPLLRRNDTSYKNIVFTSSVLAHLGVPRYSAYCSAKAGLLGLMRSLAAEEAPNRILVNAICPGWVETQMATNGLEQISKGSGKTLEEVRTEQMGMVPLKKMSTPEEIGELVSFLVSGLQTSLTGQTIDINNGALML